MLCAVPVTYLTTWILQRLTGVTLHHILHTYLMWMSVMQALFSCCGLQSVVLFSGSAYQNNLMAI